MKKPVTLYAIERKVIYGRADVPDKIVLVSVQADDRPQTYKLHQRSGAFHYMASIDKETACLNPQAAIDLFREEETERIENAKEVVAECEDALAQLKIIEAELLNGMVAQ